MPRFMPPREAGAAAESWSNCGPVLMMAMVELNGAVAEKLVPLNNRTLNVKVAPLTGMAVGVILTSTFQFGPFEPEKTPAGKMTPLGVTVTPLGVSFVL